jgi:DMSO/TMAO reductase YedYZ molybdopterin-dependent catalytic subunit
MVLSLIHYVPSAIAAILALTIGVRGRSGSHKILVYGMTGFALLGLLGFVLSDWSGLSSLNFHSVHASIGLAALVASLIPPLIKRYSRGLHCTMGRLAAVLSLVSLVMGVMILFGQVPSVAGPASNSTQVPVTNLLPEIEAGIFQGVALTPISQQGNNAIKGTQVIDRESFRLVVNGLVEKNITLTYSDLLLFPAYSMVAYMPCVEGWGFYAKWTGFRVYDLLDSAGVTGGGDYVVFYSSDGYSTGLPLSYLFDRHILLAYGLNDVTLPMDRGFPLQLVAESKYGYKWAKWIVRLEVVRGEVDGFWESRGYSNSADEGSYPFG